MNNDAATVCLPSDHSARMERALLSLDGLSVGDAFGQRFFCMHSVEALIAERAFPKPPWPYTDDTEMALAVLEVLARRGKIHPDELARTFACRYRANPLRGYGGTAHGILANLGAGVPWEVAASQVFGGMGSMGNGGAMRVAPLAAYFADNYNAVVEQARASAQVTHAHPEGQAGRHCRCRRSGMGNTKRRRASDGTRGAAPGSRPAIHPRRRNAAWSGGSAHTFP